MLVGAARSIIRCTTSSRTISNRARPRCRARHRRAPVVLPGNLQPVPGIEEQADVGAGQRAGEVADLAVEGCLVEVQARR